MSAPPPGYYEWLAFNSPMSNEVADALVERLVRSSPSTAIDIGCGWGELLLRVAARSTVTAIGVDRDKTVLERGRAAAADRGLDGRVVFRADLPSAPQDTADVVICGGADHIFGTQADALAALHTLVNPGGRLLFGSGFWERTPTAEEAATIGASPSDLHPLADLVDLAIDAGFRLLDLRTATTREWEEFELGYLADWEEWLVQWSGEPEAAEVAARADAHRNGYLRGWRGVLGFAYLVLGRPRRPWSG